MRIQQPPIKIVSPLPKTKIIEQLQILAAREPEHTQNLYGAIALLPFSLSFIIRKPRCKVLINLVPGPNLPFAYNLFRVYSNYKARQGALSIKQAAVDYDRLVEVEEINEGDKDKEFKGAFKRADEDVEFDEK